MSYEISNQLQDKLKIIEIETDFFSRKPRKPHRSRFLPLAMAAFLLAGAYNALSGENNLLLLFYVSFAVIFFLSYLHERQLFNMYSNACEIINHYKNFDESKI